MKCCFVFCCLLGFSLVSDGRFPDDMVDESVARVNEELKLSWGRGSVGRWPQANVGTNTSPIYKVRMLVPALKKSVRPSVDDLPVRECGWQSGVRISHGDVASLTQFPWLVMLFYMGNFICGGSLISAQYVLTAAHCIPRTLDPATLETFYVALGEYDTDKDPDCDDKNNCFHVSNMRVMKRIPHPKFKPKYYYFDIGLLKLAQSVQFGGNIVPICLPVSTEKDPLKNVDSFLMAGWGKTENAEFSNVKRFVNLVPVDADRCKLAHHGVDQSIHICAGGADDRKDSCMGDSGGPLMAVGKVNGSDRYIAVGVLSFGGRECGTPGIPGVYEKVSFHMNWILENMNR